MKKHVCAKRVLTVVFCLAMVLALFIPAAADSAEENSGELKVAVISDMHYLSPNMIKDTADFEYTMNFDRKLLAESDAILDEFLNAVREDQPDVLLIPGDMSSNGELLCHQQVAAKLKALQEEMPGLKIYVTTGNHDINNTDAKDYNTEDGVAVAAEPTNIEAFEQTYGFVYEDDSIIARYIPTESTQSGGLSYVARPCDGYSIIVIDSCLYSSDATSAGTNTAEVGGIISNDLRAWITAQATEAEQRGDVVLAMMHHGIVPHFSKETLIFGDFLVNDYENVAKTFADAGISYVFTGHMHANDIAAYTSESGNTVYDIETGSAVTYPSPMRSVVFTQNDGSTTANISTRLNAGPIAFTSPLTGEYQVIEDLSEYGSHLGYDAASIENLACRVIRNFVYKYVSSDRCDVNWILDKLDGHIVSIIDQVVAIPVSDEHTLIDAVNYVYQMHQSGTDNGIYPDWVQSTLDRTDSGELVSEILDIVKHEAFGSVADLMRFECLITKSVEDKIGDLIVDIADSLGNDVNYSEDNNTVITVINPVVEIEDDTDTNTGEEIDNGGENDNTNDEPEQNVKHTTVFTAIKGAVQNTVKNVFNLLFGWIK